MVLDKADPDRLNPDRVFKSSQVYQPHSLSPGIYNPPYEIVVDQVVSTWLLPSGLDVVPVASASNARLVIPSN